MKTNTTSRTLQAQSEQFKEIWQELIALQGHMRAALPEDLVRARAELGANDQEHLRSGEYYMQAFNRLAAAFTQHARPLTMGEIREVLSVPLSTATRMVDAMVENGYAERLPDPQDRRVVRVGLTTNGKQLYEMMNQFFGERMCEFLAHFTPAERKDLLRLFKKSVVVLRNLNPHSSE